MTKRHVRAIAESSDRLAGLPVLTKPESMGVCFIGKRSMPSFLSEYIDLTPGRLVVSHQLSVVSYLLVLEFEFDADSRDRYVPDT
jgi:tRNA U34 2-thiouridine synthase MnmA/TrmU